MFPCHVEGKFCPKCRINEIYKHISDLYDGYLWYRCHHCHWEWDDKLGESGGQYYKSSLGDDVTADWPREFYEKEHEWKWMPISKSEAEGRKDEFSYI
jgi:hypothetical protein